MSNNNNNLFDNVLKKGKKLGKDLGKVLSDKEALSSGITGILDEGKKIIADTGSALSDPELKEKVSKGISDAVAIGATGAKKVAEGASKVFDAGKAATKTIGEKTNEIMTSDQMVQVLNELYAKSMTGIPGISEPVDELAQDYLNKNDTPEKAARSLINNQILKCTTSGFLSGLGGAITLPISLPANITSVLYVQIRMIGAVAKIGGFDPHNDQVRSIVYACLTGQAIGDVLKSAGIKLGEKFAVSGIKKITGAALTRINQAVGFRLITKFGEKGIINLGKMVPVIGGIIGGGFDLVSTKVIAANAYKLFIEKSTDFKTADDDNVNAFDVTSPEEEIRDLYNVYSEDPDYIDHVISACEELDIPYRKTKVQIFSFMSVKCDAVKLTQLALKLHQFGEYTISVVTSDEVATIQSWR